MAIDEGEMPPAKGKNSILALPIILGIIHAVVDASTIMTIFTTRPFHHLKPYDIALIVLGYDLIAFYGQVPFGFLMDKLRRCRETAALGLVFCLFGILCLYINPIAAMIFAGIGNALYHVGGGAISLNVQPGRATPPGIFVAPGALGLAVGSYMGKGGFGITWPFLIALAISLVVTLFVKVPDIPYESPPPRPKVRRPILLVVLLLLSVFFRSLVGRAGGYELPKMTDVAFAGASAAFAGKAIGGVLADRLGWIEVSVGALLISAPLIAFGGNASTTVIIGLFIFQITMPVTLVAVWSLMPGRPGLAFGLNCLAYIAGFLMTTLPSVKALYSPQLFLGIILLSALTVYLGLKPLKKHIPMKF